MIQVLFLHSYHVSEIYCHDLKQAFDSAAHTDIAEEYNQYGTVSTRKPISRCPTWKCRRGFCHIVCSLKSMIESGTYAAEAATISCLLAFVNAERAAENTRVKTRTTRMPSELVAMVPSTENL